MKMYSRAEYDPEWTPEQQVAFAQLLRKDYATFVRFFWHTVEPKPLVWNWHIDVICNHLAALHQDTLQANKLYIAIPPGCMKSSLTSVFYDAWKWLTDPGQRCLAASHDLPLVIRDNVKCRRIVESEAYGQTLQLLAVLGFEPWTMAKDQNQKQQFENTRAGFRQCTTVGSGGTGKRGDSLVIDDPLKILDLIHASVQRQSELLLEVQSWYTDVFASRLNDLATGKQVLIMQRVHEDDLIGFLSQDPSWHGLVLPMQYDPEIADPDDPRTEPGEPLFLAKFPLEVLERQKRTMTPGQWTAQYLQRPIPTTGGLLKADWFRRRYKYVSGHYSENRFLPQMRRLVASFDCANKARKLNDPTVAMLIGEDAQGTLYLLDIRRERYEYADLEFHAPKWLADWKPHHILIEDAANGTALLSKLLRMGHKPVGIVPHQDKHVRMSNQTPWCSAGQLLLPDDGCPWLPDFLFEALKFPQVKHDDQVDALSQALAWFTDNPIGTRGTYAFSTAYGVVVQDGEGKPTDSRPVPAGAADINAQTLAAAQLKDLQSQVARLMRR